MIKKRVFALLGNAVKLKCPRCGAGRLFRRPFSMYGSCAWCGLEFEREQGYFVGAIYINYAATVMIAVPGFFVLDALTSLTTRQQLTFWVPFAVVFPVLFFHHSRSFWLAIDHLLNPAKGLYTVPRKGKEHESHP